MSLTTLLDTITEALGAVLPELDIETHRGRFDEGELKRFMISAPALRLAILGLSNPEPAGGGACDWTVRIGAMLVTRDTPALPRERAASAIVQTVLLTALQNNWGFDWVYPAKPASARNLYSQALDKAGALIWAIEWDQVVRLERPRGELQVVPSELYVGIVPETGPDHVADYIEIGGGDD